MRLLLIEDDPNIAAFIAKGLKEAGFVVEHTDNGKSGLQMALDASYDVAVIDIMLPGLDGLAIIETLRQRRIKLPVIILSAKRSVDERVEGLQNGSKACKRAAMITSPNRSRSPNCWRASKL